MYSTETVISGTLLTDGTVRLDRTPNLRPGRVEVVLREAPSAAPSSSPPPSEDWWACLQRLRAEREAAGHTFRTAEEIDAEIRELRADRELPR